MTPMVRLALAAFALAVVAQADPVQQSAGVTGEWALQFTTPRGHAEFTMYLSQEGPRVTGHLTSEYGEVQIRCTINGDEIRITWSQMEGGKPLEITLTGKVKGDAMSGTARLGTVGEGPFTADRTAS